MFDNVLKNDLDNDFEKIELPWIIFKVSKNTYAVNSEDVLSITKMEDEIIDVPDIQEYIRGLINLRGSIIPLIDLKKLFKEDSLDKIVADYSEMIGARKQDHINWVNELDRCIENGEQFKLATDPHKCAFGKWFYSYKPENNTIGFHIKKIEEPHRLLHEAAEEYNNCNKDHANCQREECLKDVLQRVKEEYMPEVVRILDDSISVLKNNLKEMIIVLEHDHFKAGIIVDSVLSIETISGSFEQGNMNKEYYNTKFISGVGKSDKTGTTVLKVDVCNILSKIDDIDMTKIELSEEIEFTDKNEVPEETEDFDEKEILEYMKEIGYLDETEEPQKIEEIEEISEIEKYNI